jgi:CTP:molybdopterin cytidylyltransferase MocA
MKNAYQINWKKISVIILSAGKSERFRSPKAFLKFDSNSSFLGYILSTYVESHLDTIIVVLNRHLEEAAGKIIFPFSQKLNLIQVINNHPEKGRYNSIRFGASVLKRKSPAFIQNIDNPFITREMVGLMISKLQKGSYVVPVCKGKRGHPVLVCPEILDRIRMHTNDDTDLRYILRQYNCIEVEVEDERIHANINTVEEYRKYFVHETIES